MKKNNRNDIIISLIGKGFTYEKAGFIFGLSKQSVYAINKDSKDNKDLIERCVNCGLEGKSIDNNTNFLFKKDPINLCLSCTAILKNC